MSFDSREYRTCLRAAKVLAKGCNASQADFVAALIRNATVRFGSFPTGPDVPGGERPEKNFMAKHVHSELLRMKVDPDIAWSAAGLDELIGG